MFIAVMYYIADILINTAIASVLVWGASDLLSLNESSNPQKQKKEAKIKICVGMFLFAIVTLAEILRT